MDKTVEKAFKLIEVLADSATPRGVTDLSEACNWSKSSTFRMLSTLVALGIVVRAGENSGYALGLKLWQLGGKVVSRLDVRTLALPTMQALAAETGETILLAILDGSNIVYLEQIESSHPVRAGTQVGGTAPTHCTANGKALLAFQSPETIEQFFKFKLPPFTDKTLRSADALRKELALTRTRGFALVHDEWQEGVAGVAAPIFDAKYVPVAALGVSGPSHRLNRKRATELGPRLRTAAESISRRLGYGDASAYGS